MPKADRPVRACRTRPEQRMTIINRDIAVHVPDKFRWDLYQEQPSGRFVLKNKGHGQETTVDAKHLRGAIAAAVDRRTLARAAHEATKDTVALNAAATSSGIVQVVAPVPPSGAAPVPPPVVPSPPPTQLLTNMVPSRNYYSRTPIVSPTRHQEMVAIQDTIQQLFQPALNALRTPLASQSPTRVIDPTPPRSRSTSRNPQ